MPPTLVSEGPASMAGRSAKRNGSVWWNNGRYGTISPDRHMPRRHLRGSSMSFPTDLEIARQATPKPLTEIASMMGIGEHLLEPYGRELAKISLDAIDELADRPRAKYVVVTAITPTPLGEGKTTTTVGLGQAMK